MKRTLRHQDHNDSEVFPGWEKDTNRWFDNRKAHQAGDEPDFFKAQIEHSLWVSLGSPEEIELTIEAKEA